MSIQEHIKSDTIDLRGNLIPPSFRLILRNAPPRKFVRTFGYARISVTAPYEETLEKLTKAGFRGGHVIKAVNPEKQSRHYRNSDGYTEGRSYLFDDVNAQELVDRYHGTGHAEMSESGVWKNKESINADSDIGININPISGEKTTTNRFTIHYSRTGTHVVPAERLLIL